MAQWIMHLLLKCEDWSSDSQSSYKNLGGYDSLPVVSVLGTGDRGSLGPSWMGELRIQ